jgi:uncharacterized protein YacL
LIFQNSVSFDGGHESEAISSVLLASIMLSLLYTYIRFIFVKRKNMLLNFWKKLTRSEEKKKKKKKEKKKKKKPREQVQLSPKDIETNRPNE